MTDGFIVKSICEHSDYFGIDATNPKNEVWPFLNEWNNISPQNPILLSKDEMVYEGKYSSTLFMYQKWLTDDKGFNESHLLFFSTLPEQTTAVPDPKHFNFIGYDCAYTVDENAEYILFFALHNEMTSQNASLYALKGSLNKYGLFDDIHTAGQFLEIRQQMMEKGEGNLETAWKNLEPEIVKVYLFVDPDQR